MEPVSPVIPGHDEVVYAKHQKEYTPLPLIKDINGKRLSRWTFSDEERKAIAEGADLFVCIHSKHFQPPIALGVIEQDKINLLHSPYIRDSFGMDEILGVD